MPHWSDTRRNRADALLVLPCSSNLPAQTFQEIPLGYHLNAVGWAWDFFQPNRTRLPPLLVLSAAPCDGTSSLLQARLHEHARGRNNIRDAALRTDYLLAGSGYGRACLINKCGVPSVLSSSSNLNSTSMPYQP